MCKLKEFVENKMRMTAIYQPVIIKSILLGNESLDSIAEEISLLIDGSKANSCHYVNKLKIHPKKVLNSHGIATIKPRSGKFTFLSDLEIKEKEAVLSLCDLKIQEFLNK